MELHQKKCHPSSAQNSPLSLAEKKSLLSRLHPDWRFDCNQTRIFREVQFPNFTQAIDFAVKVGEISEQQNHHPELRIGMGFCRVEVWTHTVEDLMEIDFIYAAKIDHLCYQSEI